ncbi:DUF3995 domain-containing protein [Fibrella arboris]|uniref:DUF3995 domain-containing protein n=1 Tax=Fibrella arboris TaxID=3242486 RepID=UPI00352209E2
MIPALLNTALLLTISGLHLYWAFGGKWGVAVAIPELAKTPGAKVVRPGPGMTLAVAVGLACMAGLHLYKIGWLAVSLPTWLEQYGLWLVGAIFFLRVIGDFRYVGFFKRVTDTPFAQMDTAYYIPLCLIISISAFWTAVSAAS